MKNEMISNPVPKWEKRFINVKCNFKVKVWIEDSKEPHIRPWRVWYAFYSGNASTGWIHMNPRMYETYMDARRYAQIRESNLRLSGFHEIK